VLNSRALFPGEPLETVPCQFRVVKFGIFEADLEAGELRKSGVRFKLPGEPFQVLQILLEHPGEVVSREELQKQLWPDNVVVDYDLALKKE
jgi:DNA-binding winged helix-turn-helix (wHTH) protein